MTYLLSHGNPKSYLCTAIQNFGRMSWLVTQHGKSIGGISSQMRSPPRITVRTCTKTAPAVIE
ncbi:hypothetical protein [Laspinema olomoucense]|uniref:hypothetical protein n=1 Tax=Laspinema olomoucense TaxID=3231600 RepID=UPI0021BAB61A|nr:hypothetical protein [Laspinema sp. D3d]MCT7971120.1 hypothetical protein [Laspinema sp. D3d]